MLAAQGVVAAVGLSGLDDGAGELAGAGGVEADVEESGAGDLHGGDAVEGLKTRDEELGEIARLSARLLGQLHGHVGGPVAVVAVAGTLDARVGDLGGGQGEGASAEASSRTVRMAAASSSGVTRVSVPSTGGPDHEGGQ